MTWSGRLGEGGEALTPTATGLQTVLFGGCAAGPRAPASDVLDRSADCAGNATDLEPCVFLEIYQRANGMMR